MLNCLLNNTAAITIAALICELPETKRPQNTLPVSPAVAGKIAYQTHFHSSRSVAPLGLSVPSVRELEPSAVSARGECDSSSRITPTICNRHIQSIIESFQPLGQQTRKHQRTPSTICYQLLDQRQQDLSRRPHKRLPLKREAVQHSVIRACDANLESD